MRITKMHWVAAASLVIIGIVVRQIKAGHFDSAKDQISTATVSEEASSRLTDLEPTRDSASRVPSKSWPRTVNQPSDNDTRPASNTASRNQGESLSARPAMSGSNSVIGQKFPMSASVDAGCKKTPDDICKEALENLDKLAKESRDPLWASQMEALIQNSILNEDPGTHEIRDIECRTTFCAVEVVSTTSGTYVPYLGGKFDDPVRNFLKASPVTDGVEADINGNRVVIDLVTFSKR
jgi:hypothetical protein